MEIDPIPIVQEAGWIPGPVWTGAVKSFPPGFDPRTFQTVAFRYFDSAFQAQCSTNDGMEKCMKDLEEIADERRGLADLGVNWKDKINIGYRGPERDVKL